MKCSVPENKNIIINSNRELVESDLDAIIAEKLKAYDLQVFRKGDYVLLFALFVCLCLTSHRQRGHSETAPPFTVPCEGLEAR